MVDFCQCCVCRSSFRYDKSAVKHIGAGRNHGLAGKTSFRI